MFRAVKVGDCIEYCGLLDAGLRVDRFFECLEVSLRDSVELQLCKCNYPEFHSAHIIASVQVQPTPGSISLSPFKKTRDSHM